MPMAALREALRSSTVEARAESRHEQVIGERLDALRAKGVTIEPELEHQILTEPRRQAALLQRDFTQRGTALDHIQRVADAGQLADGSPSAVLAADMLKLAGTVRDERGWGMSYARANQAVFTAHHAGEFNRLIADLGVSRTAELAGGQRVRWDLATLPIAEGRHLEFLWGSLNHMLIGDALPADAPLPPPPTPHNEPVARRGQMANMMTRLTGEPWVNVSARNALPKLNPIVDEFGPALARYGDHAGSVAVVEGNVPLSLEAGNPEPQRVANNLDWVVLPYEVAKKNGMEPIRYREDLQHYIHDAVPPMERPQLPKAPKGKTLGLNEMAESLEALGVPIGAGIVSQIASDPARLAALNQRDYLGKGTTFEHIFNIASIGRLHDGSDSRSLAGDLFAFAGTNPSSRNGGLRCYARTLFGVYMKERPAELARLVGDLAVRGETTLAGGRTVRWDPRQWAIQGGAPETLFGGLAHTIKFKNLQDGTALVNNGEYAYQAEMANIHTRLTGRRYVNVQGAQAVNHINEVVGRTGPLLAEYGAHGGSLAGYQGGRALSMENGSPALGQQNIPGYVAFPEDEAVSRRLTIVQPTDPARGYAEN
jgi:hypothetical protein